MVLWDQGDWEQKAITQFSVIIATNKMIDK